MYLVEIHQLLDRLRVFVLLYTALKGRALSLDKSRGAYVATSGSITEPIVCDGTFVSCLGGVSVATLLGFLFWFFQ